MSQTQISRTSVGAWVVYDVANTVFWTGVVGLSFPLWLTNDKSGDDATLGFTLAATMAVVLIAAPILGALSDQAKRRVPLLIISTVVCIAATLALGQGHLIFSLALFALALCSMELGTIFYNALLAHVSNERNRGTIAGMGTGIGYIGAFIAVGVALLFSDPKGYVFVFRVVAILFLLFSLPIFTLLNERPRHVITSTFFGKATQAFTQLNRNLRNMHRFPGLRQFLLGRFLYTLGISTATVFAVVYASDTIGLSDREIQLVLLAGISVAIPSGILWGRIIDRVGAKPVLDFTLLVWVGLLLLAVGIYWFSWSSHLWWVVGCITGVVLAGTFTADRPYMLTFTPPEYTGEFFGLHGMIGKLGRVLGPFMWGLISATLGFGQPAAILGLAGCLLLSYVILRGLNSPVTSSLAYSAD